MNLNERINILKNVEMFRQVSQDILEQLADDLQLIKYGKGDVLVKKGAVGEALMIILDGEVIVTDQGHVFSRLKKGDVIGEYYLIDSRPHSADVVAYSKTEIMLVSQELFQKVTGNYTSVDAGVMRFLVGRLRNMNVIEEELARKNREVIEQKKQLEKLNATKDKFFSIIGHDLRSPTATLITLSEMLISDLEEFDDGTILELLGDVNKVAHNNLKLLNGLLEWARSQQGRIPYEPKEHSFNSVIGPVLLTYRKTAEDKGVELVDSVEGSYKVYVDINMISSVLRNLISNAIKYCSKGDKIYLSVKKEEGFLRVFVRDTGLGIGEDVQKKLFRLDCHYTTTGTANELGTGLGLILCREFVEKNGGSLDLESVKGAGSTFSFTVPVSD